MEEVLQIYPWPEGLENVPPSHPYFPVYDGEGKTVGIRNLTEGVLDMTCNEQISIGWLRRPKEWALEDCSDDEL